MAELDLEIVRGDEAVVDLTFDPAINLTDTAWFTAKRSYRDSDADAVILCKTGGQGLVIDTTTTGTLTIPATATDDLPGERVELVCDIQVKQLGGQPKTAGRGRLIVAPDVTIAAT